MQITRSLIEFTRAGFMSIGIDVRRRQAPRPPNHLEIINALRQIRDAGGSDEEHRFLAFCANRIEQSNSQLLQDLFVLYTLGSAPGYFVEFGAMDGLFYSNTLLLERSYGWTGILAEPAKCFRDVMAANRTCTVSSDCVWSRTGETLLFNETDSKALSTLDAVTVVDAHTAQRAHGHKYEVTTVSLNDLLTRHHAPAVIDYMSIDTEGSELSILEAFDFSRHTIRCITVEHNFTSNRAPIHAILTANGFERKFTSLSDIDDWYVRLTV